MNVGTAFRHPVDTMSAERPGGPGAGRVLVVNSSSFGPVSLSLAWVNGGAFVFSAAQPPARRVPLGQSWFRESRWGAALVVSLPDGVHVFDATEVQVALHAAGVALGLHESVDFLAETFLRGVAALGTEQVRRVAAEWRKVCDGLADLPDSVWFREMRRVWGTRKQMDRASLAKFDLLGAVMGRG
ncbi:hypothetical protein L3Q67_08915 [Saccharothrix sp. AJ9571]|nr:hypothetical protein L3Q67_08915 [Saccharothrix sp. AJ9571]